MTYFFETYGCQMNVAESFSVERIFTERGWTKSPSAQTADFVIINTCTVRATAESRIAGRLGWYDSLKLVRSLHPDAKYHVFPEAAALARSNAGKPPPLTLAVMGCMAERLLQTLKKDFPAVDYVIGNFQKKNIADILQAVEQGKTWIPIDEEPVYSFAQTSYEKGSFSAFVPIMHGCNNFCTYCIVPYVRGREVSRPPEEILKEIDELSANNVREITVLGQNVNSYIWQDIDFPTLMKMIAEHLKKTNSPVGWVRFMSSHPKDISDRLIEVIRDERVMCRHIHLPVQHGSNAVLGAMNRRYTRESYLETIDKIKNLLPDASLSTDILVGFPGETEADVDDTLDLMEKVQFVTAFMYYYNPREGTKACTFENQIPMEIKKKRLAKIITLQHRVIKELMSRRLGQTVTVLAESLSRDNKEELLGKTEQDERVVFTAGKESIGSFIQVKLIELTGNTFRGIVV